MDSSSDRLIWTEKQMEDAIWDVVELKYSQNAAAQRNGVPQPTLSRRLRGQIPRNEVELPQQVLTQAQREHLTHWILTQEGLGHAPSHAQIRACVLAILRKEMPHKEPTLGRNWVARFIESNPDLKTKYARRHEAVRWEAFNPTAVGWFFDNLEQYSWIKPENICNVDEGGIMTGFGTFLRFLCLLSLLIHST